MILAVEFVSSVMLTYINLQLDIESRKRKRQRQATESAIEELTSMGFERSEGILLHIDMLRYFQVLGLLFPVPYLFYSFVPLLLKKC